MLLQLSQVPCERLRVCDSGVCLTVWSPVKGVTPQLEKIESIVSRSAADAYQYLRTYGGLKFDGDSPRYVFKK